MATTQKAPNTDKLAETPAPVTTHSEFLTEHDPRILAAIEAMEELKSTNEVRRAVKVTEMTVLPGKQKMRDGAPIFDEQGNPEFWESSHFINTRSEYGEVNVRVTKEMFDKCELNKWYVLIGRIVIKAPFEGNRMFEAITYTDIQPLHGIKKA